MTSSTSEPIQPYALGHSVRELERLRSQARFLEPITRGFLRDAGITRGMRVLDVGSGTGAVAFAAELVGETGEVIGTDTAATAIAKRSICRRSVTGCGKT